MTIQHRLIEGLTDADAGIRKRSAYILGTVDEVAALDRLYQQYAAERDSDAKQAIQWAGRRLKAIRETGYTTLDALFIHYRMSDAEAQQPNRAEQQVIDDYKLHTHMSALDSETRSAAANTALNVLLLPPIFSAGRFLSGGFSSAEVGTKLDAMEYETSEPLVRAHKPPRPGNESIAPVLQRLRAATDPQRRIDLVLDLAQIYNHQDALPHLAALFVRDPDDHVRETAQRAAKLIYWNALYWDMEVDGSLARELAQRGVTQTVEPLASSNRQESDIPTAPQSDIADILRKAEEARERRHRGR